MRRKQMDVGCDDAVDWLKCAGEFVLVNSLVHFLTASKDILRVKDVTLAELDSRPENASKDRKKAQRYMEQVENAIERQEQPIHCFSTRVLDRNGELLVGYFAQSVKSKVSYGAGSNVPSLTRSFSLSSRSSQKMRTTDSCLVLAKKIRLTTASLS
jgi:hypothetical protein